jgi:agmatine deiminase
MTVAVTTADRPDRVWIIVSDAGQQTSATTALTGASPPADMSRVEFLIAPTNTVWIRDYGPRFVDDDGTLAIVDHEYNRPRPQDDAIPVAVAIAWGLPRYEIPLVHGGGNFHLFATGEGFMTDLVLAENPALSETTVEDLFTDFENLDVAIGDPFPTSYDSTQHIDMWMLPVRDRVAIVGEYPAATGIPHTVTEAMTADLVGRGWTVHRTPGWRANFTHYTYANAVVLDGIVLVPQFASYPTQNAAALATFAAAFPDREVVGIDSSTLVQSAGVLHCIVMHVPAPRLFVDGFEGGDAGAWGALEP